MKKIVLSAGVVAASTLASRITGLIRDMILAALFGASASADAFYAAFRIPNLVRRFTAEGVLTVSYIPVYVEYRINKGRQEALELAQKTLTLLLVMLAALVALGLIFAPGIVRIIAAGFDDRLQIQGAVVMTRIMFPYIFFAGVLAFCMGLLNAHDYFFAPSFALVLLNIGIIAGVVFFSGFFEEPLFGVCAGVLFGGLMQILLQIPYMARAGFRMKWSFDLKHPGVRRIFKLALPGAFCMGIQQVNILAATVLGSYLPSGSISYIYFSDRLHELVLGIFAVSIGNAVMPELSALAADRNYAKLVAVYVQSIKSVLFFAIPATAALMSIGFPIISVVLMHNNFTAFEADMTYRALFYASMGIASIAVNRITVPTFFALNDSRTPLIAAFASFIINGLCGLYFMHTPLRHAGLTLSVAIAATVQMLVLVVSLRKKIGDIGLAEISKSLAKYGIAAGIMAAVIWNMADFIDWKTAALMKRLIILMFIILSGGAVYLISCYVAGVSEVRGLMSKLLKR